MTPIMINVVPFRCTVDLHHDIRSIEYVEDGLPHVIRSIEGVEDDPHHDKRCTFPLYR